MRRVPIVLCLALVLSAPWVRAWQRPQFRGGTNTVSIYATVADAAGRLVTGLTRDDFEVLDNGTPQDLTVFSSDIQPITIVIMLDRSGSMMDNFNLVQRAAEEFVENLLPADKARLGNFSNDIQIDPPAFTSDRAELLRILGENLQAAGPTPLWNATAAAMDALANETGRRVVLVFTDGKDSTEGPDVTHTFAEVRDRSRAEEIMVYGIGLSDGCAPAPAPTPAAGRAPAGAAIPVLFQGRGRIHRYPPRIPSGPIRGVPPILIPELPVPGRVPVPEPSIEDISGCRKRAAPDPQLRELAEVGGGGYFELHSTDDLSSTFARVADELHHQYLLAFTATALDNQVHQLQVRVREPALTVCVRTSYVASR
jgi:VWFA-related protein